jgi:hypothetical protein
VDQADDLAVALEMKAGLGGADRHADVDGETARAVHAGEALFVLLAGADVDWQRATETGQQPQRGAAHAPALRAPLERALAASELQALGAHQEAEGSGGRCCIARRSVA